MFSKLSATLATLLALGVPSLAQAQQPTRIAAHSDSTHAVKVRARDQRALTRDTTRLHREIAVRDSLRTSLERGHARTRTLEARIDSMQAVLERHQKATPPDTAAIRRDRATIARLRQEREQGMDRDKRERARLDSLEQRVRQEWDTVSGARQALEKGRPVPASRPDTAKKR